MKIKWSHPRNTPDLYSDSDFANICKKLGISNSKNKKLFKECVERAAQDFIKWQKDNSKKLTLSQETKALEKLAQHLKKSKKAYEVISEESQMSVFRFFHGFKNLKNKHKSEKEFLLNYIIEDGYFLKPEKIKNILEMLENVALEASKQPSIFLKKNKTNLVLQWLWGFSDEWEELSGIKISEGRYGEKELKYISPAMEVLDELAVPLKISNSQIAEAIKVYREKKKTEVPFDLEDYFQEGS